MEHNTYKGKLLFLPGFRAVRGSFLRWVALLRVRSTPLDGRANEANRAVRFLLPPLTSSAVGARECGLMPVLRVQIRVPSVV